MFTLMGSQLPIHIQIGGWGQLTLFRMILKLESVLGPQIPMGLACLGSRVLMEPGRCQVYLLDASRMKQLL